MFNSREVRDLVCQIDDILYLSQMSTLEGAQGYPTPAEYHLRENCREETSSCNKIEKEQGKTLRME